MVKIIYMAETIGYMAAQCGNPEIVKDLISQGFQVKQNEVTQYLIKEENFINP